MFVYLCMYTHILHNTCICIILRNRQIFNVCVHGCMHTHINTYTTHTHMCLAFNSFLNQDIK